MASYLTKSDDLLSNKQAFLLSFAIWNSENPCENNGPIDVWLKKLRLTYLLVE